MADKKKVLLHVYDVTNSPDPNVNNTVLRINGVARSTLGIGGIFHGAVEVFGEEWSFGYCERGSGVFSCRPKSNPYYTYRETVDMGETKLSAKRAGQIIAEMSVQWPGVSYDMLGRNCNHFCDELCVKLGVGPIPAWVNRFARTGDSAAELYDQVGQQVAALQEWGSGTYNYWFGAENSAAAASSTNVGGAAGAPAAGAGKAAGSVGSAAGLAAPVGSVQGRSWAEFWSGRKGDDLDGAELLEPGEERSTMGVCESEGRGEGDGRTGRVEEGDASDERKTEASERGTEEKEKEKGGIRASLPLLPTVPPEANTSNSVS